MYRLLVVDDEKEICTLITKYAKFEGNEVETASNGMDAVEMVRNNGYDLIIMDVMMPELDGFSAVSMIRKFSDTPIIMLSARGEEYDRIHGFEIGVDDYVTKEADHDVYRYQGLQIDFTARTVTIDGERIALSPKEYDLLFYMVRNKDIALSRDRLLSEVWGYDFFGVDRTLDTHVKLLRKKLGDYARCVVTLRGVGYRFEEA